nr:phosphoethanolamine--lipid A transferase [Pseudomonas aeruginosa]
MILATALWLLLFSNWPFWREVWQGVGGWQSGNSLFLLSLPLFVLLWLFLLLSLLTWGRLTKPVLALALLVSAAASYFMNSYGIVIDHGMLTNLLQTDTVEATELLSWKLVAWLLGFGVLPVLFISRVRLTQRSWSRELAMKGLGMVVALACLAGIVLTQYQPYASLVRNHRELRLMLVPSNVVAAAHGYAKRQLAAPVELQVVGTDAHRIERVSASRKPKLTVLVVGETARAANFALNGYPRDTNPELTKRGVLSFGHVSSCGTATAVSLPCMFLDVGQHNYEDGLAMSREGLLDVLQRAGVAVLWRDNNSGCKGVCDRVPHEEMDHQQVMGLCRSDECYDEILLHGLQAYLDRQQDDTLVVLHMKGSHGPSYFKRYPLAFERFSPVCDNNQLDRCDRQSIVNAYDNSLSYTDYVLGQTIDLLKRNSQRFDTGMLYVSDHGESLGENGLYLHGLPYAMAPREQTHIPMLLWLSDELLRSKRLDANCLSQERGRALSHDNLFHSMLGLMEVHTNAYRADLDLFRACRPVAERSLAARALPQSAEN